MSSPSNGRIFRAGTAVTGTKTRLLVKVVPGASRNGIAGWLGEALRVRVSAPPERGKANAAVEKVIAEALGLPNDAVNIVKGPTSPRKVVEITGLSEHEIRSQVDELIG